MTRKLESLLKSAMGALRSLVTGSVIDFSILTVQERILAGMGYLSMLGLLFFTLTAPLYRPYVLKVQYILDGRQEAPVFVIILAGLGFSLGLAYFLTGGLNCKPWVFIPVVVGFILLALTRLYTDRSGWVMVVKLLVDLVLVGQILIFYFAALKRPSMRGYPLVAFWTILFVLLVLEVLPWIDSDITGLAKGVDSGFTLFMVFVLVFWLWAGFGVINLAIDWSRSGVAVLYRLFPVNMVTPLQATLILTHPALMLGVTAMTYLVKFEPGYLFAFTDALAALLVAAAMVIVFMIRKWNPRSAGVLMTLSLTCPVFALGFVNVDISNLTGQVMQSVGLVNPVYLFAFFMVYNVLSFIPGFARVDGKKMPRRGRMLIAFGFAILVNSYALYAVNMFNRDLGIFEHMDRMQQFTDVFFPLSILLIGPFYLGWTLWKRPERFMLNEETLGEPFFSGLVWFSPWAVRGLFFCFLVVFNVCICLFCYATAQIQTNP